MVDHGDLTREFGTMTAKAEIAGRLPVRRGFSEMEAAGYLSLSPSFFRQLVIANKMPRPRLIGTRRVFDIDELDTAFKAMPREGGETESEAADSMADWS
jgi:excisionase family DNA binding protein